MKKFYRIDYQGTPRHAIEEGGRWHLLAGDLFGTHRAGEEIAPDAHRRLAPVLPSKLVCIGLNYKDHAAEQNKPLPASPLMFIKPSTSVIGPEDAVVIPPGIGRVDHEAEVGVVIGRLARHVAEADARGYVLGLTCVNDVTARELQQKGAQYTHAKGFDTFAPIGPCIAVGLDPSALDIEGWVNAERRHKSNTRELIFPVPYLIEHVTRFMTLQPGDVITTGTPSGVGPLAPGDRMTVKVEGVGTLSNPCIAG